MKKEYDVIERYISSVVSRLSEKDREEVANELRANILDMVGDEPKMSDVEAVLYELGAPDELARKYTSRVNYLISPKVYYDYIGALKVLVPIVGVVLLIVGCFLGTFDGLNQISDPSDITPYIAAIISSALSKGIGLAISGALQALVWTTIGFVIYERVSYGKRAGEEAAGQNESSDAPSWKLSDLPPVEVKGKKRIPLSDSIAELVLVGIFTIVTVILCMGIVPFAFVFTSGDTKIYEFFDPAFLKAIIPLIAGLGILGAANSITRIIRREWDMPVFIVTMVDCIGSVILWIVILSKPNIISSKFLDFVENTEFGGRALSTFFQNGHFDLALIIMLAIIIIVSIIECIHAVYKTFFLKTK